RHVVRWIDTILIGYLRGYDRDSANFACGKINIRIDREGSWTTGHDRGCDVTRAAGRTRNREPVACYVNRLAEGDSDVGVRRLIDRAIGRSRRRHPWRHVSCGETKDK